MNKTEKQSKALIKQHKAELISTLDYLADKDISTVNNFYEEVKIVMIDKLNLVLTEKDLLTGIKNSSADFSAKLKTDLITILKYMIKNRTLLKIDLSVFEKRKDCGTYRCVCGLWAYCLNIPIKTKTDRLTIRFQRIFRDDDLWKGFARTKKLQSNFSFNEAFFEKTNSLEKRLARARKLKVI